MLLRTTLAVGLVAACASAQGVNCTLLGRLDQYSTYNDVWGYVAPNGDEYALLGITTGTSVIDVTNPAAPVERGFFPGPSSTWRDIRTYGHYAYVVTEGGGGFQVIDLNNPNAPVLVGTVGASDFSRAHNICVDVGAGRIYIVGTGGSSGTPVYDCAANPANPPLIGNALPTNLGNPNSTYFHDLCVENGYAYGSMIYNGDLRIMSTTALPLPILSNTQTPGNFTHNAWPNAAGTICVTTDEVNGGVVKFYDVTNKSAPVALGQFTPNASSIVHNAYIVGNYCHVSWYSEGYRCIDISDPNNPVEVASYDTYAAPSTSYDGAWGVYPFLPSGNILVNDIDTGLYVVKPLLTDLSIAHAPLTDTTNERDPYPVVATVTTSNGLQSVALTYRIEANPPVTVPMAPTANPNEFAASIPAQLAPTHVAYQITATDSVGSRTSPAQGEHTFFVGTLTRVWFDDVEIDRGWTSGMVATQDDWQRGTPGGSSGTSGGIGWADPGSAYSGANAWGNDLAIGNFNGAYQNNVNNWLQSPAIPTNGVQGLHFRYRRWITLASGDQGRVLVNGNVVATVPQNTRDTSWQWIDHDISAIANTAAALTLRFELITNGTVVAGGWTLDDFEIYVETDCTPAEFYGAGTAGTGAIVPQLALLGEPRIGLNVSVEGAGLLGGAGCFWALGLVPANLPVFGITGLVDPAYAVFTFGIANGLPGAAGAGAVSFPLGIPNNALFDNIDLFNQIVVLDGGAPGGAFAATQGMRFRVCRL